MRARTFCFLSIIFSASRRRDQKCPLCSDGFPQRWATSRLWRKKWADCKSASPRPRRVPLLPCRRCTCRRMILPTRLRLRPSLILIRRWCCRALSRSSVSTRRLTRLIPVLRSLIRRLSASVTIWWRAVCRKFSSATRICKTSSPFSVWRSSPMTTSKRWRGRAKFRSISLSRSS